MKAGRLSTLLTTLPIIFAPLLLHPRYKRREIIKCDSPLALDRQGMIKQLVTRRENFMTRIVSLSHFLLETALLETAFHSWQEGGHRDDPGATSYDSSIDHAK